MASRSSRSTWPMPSATSSRSTRKASWCALPAPSVWVSATESGQLLILHHGINQRVQLVAFLHLDVRLLRMPVADYVDGGSVFDLDGLAQIAIGLHLGGELTLRIDHEGQTYLVLTGELISVSTEVLGIDLKLVRKDVIAKLVPQIFRSGVEVARHHCGSGRPIVRGDYKVVPHHGYLVGLRGLFENGRHAATLRALQILENYDGHLRALGRTQHRIRRVSRRRADGSGQGQCHQR